MKSGDLSIVYGILALFSALLCVTYLFFDQRKNRLFLSLFGCVAAANSGYFLMAICNSLAVARIANGISYFGGAFSILVMLLIVYDVCRMPKRRWFCGVLVGISVAAFALAASGDWLGLYYRSASSDLWYAVRLRHCAVQRRSCERTDADAVVFLGLVR